MTATHEPVNFPLAAVVGADALKLALCLAVVDPAIGGVLVGGARGVAENGGHGEWLSGSRRGGDSKKETRPVDQA